MSTKAESLSTVVKSGTDLTQKQRILELLKDKTYLTWTREGIAEELGMIVSSVCGRLNELVADGSVAVSDNTWSVKTNRNVNTYKAVK